MNSITDLLLLSLLAYGAVGSSVEDALNSKLIGSLISQQSPVEAAATMAHTSPLASVASMAPMMMDYGVLHMSPYGYPMPYASPAMPYMGAGVPFSPFSAPATPHPYSGIGFPGMSPLAAFPAYTSANPLMPSMPANPMLMPFPSASTFGYF